MPVKNNRMLVRSNLRRSVDTSMMQTSRGSAVARCFYSSSSLQARLETLIYWLFNADTDWSAYLLYWPKNLIFHIPVCSVIVSHSKISPAQLTKAADISFFFCFTISP